MVQVLANLNKWIEFMSSFSYMHLGNLELLEEIHAAYLADPQSVEESWRYFFEGVEFGAFLHLKEEAGAKGPDLRLFTLLDAYRRYGHLKAKINPIALGLPDEVPELILLALGFSESDLNKSFPTCGFLANEKAPLREIIEALEKTYCGAKGVEYMECPLDLGKWVQKEIEPVGFTPHFSIEKKKEILANLNKAELFETFLHKKYVGQKRFSLEGGETLIPVLKEIIEVGGEHGVDELVIGMAHRGRLNVLTNVLDKSFSMIFSEFEDFLDPNLMERAGDVKYHTGFSSDVVTKGGKKIHINVTANPSHLESVDPVVEGKVRGKQCQRAEEGMRRVVPVLIHGDSSLAGQGVVYETMQFSKVPGYGNGGTIHIVVNNQIGFTTLPKEYRTSRYSTDIAHAFGFPVFHVNAEDPEGCVYATELAVKIRQLFQVDVFIEINCYRKYGHNESDEPLFTQPLEYTLIQKKKPIREIYRDELIHQGIVEKEMALALEEEYRQALRYELEEYKVQKEMSIPEAFGGVWKEYRKATKQELLEPVQTAVDQSILELIGERLAVIPPDFALHKKLVRLVESRRNMALGKVPLDWAMGEQLAFASLLLEGTPIRLSGQDSQRGTFTHRHAVFVDQKTGGRYFPLSHLKEGQGNFMVYNSILSEFGVLGFEFGYSLSSPASLVLWEAQFGDFANGGQTIFDQYIASSEQKWKRYSGLVVLLPHGYEGQGSEHSSARIERFLQLAAESNMQIVYPTTPSQYFHLLRRQVKRRVRIPLIVFTPKGLLRHPMCVSSIEELSSGTFQEILEDTEASEEAKRVLLCTGRVYYDLLAERRNRGLEKEIAIVRIEQLYPLHHEKLSKALEKYSSCKEFYWVQEEPRNMGAFGYIYQTVEEFLPKKAILQYVGRNRSASTATGSHSRHAKEHQQIMEMAFARS
ncbi:MAG: 2-oxoglutarate dehydrogenase E1 component [Chlamydiae bacterium]|nr:2-oxoglutarate dehydrogenase E1 component [Chlamydiota bacterium]